MSPATAPLLNIGDRLAILELRFTLLEFCYAAL